MNDARTDLKNLRHPLPELKLPRLVGGDPFPTRARGRKSPVLLLRHPPGCGHCDAYLERLVGIKEEIDGWDGRVVVVVPQGTAAPDSPADPHDEPFPVAVDAGGRLASALAVESPALVIADQWGEVHLAEQAGPDHHFPAVEEVVEWLRYLAIHCPECEGEVL